MIAPSLFALAVCKLDEATKRYQDEERVDEILRMLEIATTIEAEHEDELSNVALRMFKNLSKEDARFIVELRNSKPFSNFPLKDEKFVYKIFRKLFK